MYLDYYQLKAKPFQITSDPKFLWLGEKHKEALATLRYGILDNRGFLLLTGEVGTGKTILINRLVSMLDLDTVVATLPDPDLISMDFYNLLADGFKMNRTFESKGAFLIHLRDFLYKSYASKKQVLLVIDESQRLNHHLMEDIRVLSNIELHDRKLINIFFVGQQEFNTILAAPQNRALAQRITVRYHIAPLEKEEIDNYIHHRLKIAGSNQKLFSDDAIEEVYQFSGGIPRLINIICDHALLTGYARDAKKVGTDIIKECAEELRIPLKHSVGYGQNPAAHDSKSIATAIKKDEKRGTDQASGASQQQSQNTTDPQNPGAQAAPARSPLWKLFYAAIVVALLIMGGIIITHISSPERPRWDIDTLTPDKYKTTLEREKKLLTEKMKLGEESGETKADHQADQSGAPSTVTRGPQGAVPAAGAAATGPAATNTPQPENNARDDKTRKLKAIEPLPLMKEKITVHFKVNSNEIDDRSYALLDRIAEYLVQNPDETIHVRGYTDSSGSSSYNESVSRFRASAVKSYLVGKGVSSIKIQVFAMGDAFPIAPNDTIEGRSQNRRVEIEFFRNPAIGLPMTQ